MIRELTNQEYETLIPTHPIYHFMGGVAGDKNVGESIYLTEGKIWLISNDDIEAIQRHEAIMKLETEEYMSTII